MKTVKLASIYRIPALLSLLTLTGLVFALFGAGMWDFFSWITLSMPLLVIGWMWTRPIRQGKN
jgi:hypothetical protein